MHLADQREAMAREHAIRCAEAEKRAAELQNVVGLLEAQLEAQSKETQDKEDEREDLRGWWKETLTRLREIGETDKLQDQLTNKQSELAERTREVRKLQEKLNEQRRELE